ncbi:beta-1,3-galactosyltransferase 7-like isoform X1 [Primulina huaijiensis]|uniref:beta-1,3-galactosyltransferase 7-like isoform X1 n=1 Tax=Primulina huaijiensis TaxID=1492673 RepID=UPI003CC77F2A
MTSFEESRIRMRNRSGRGKVSFKWILILCIIISFGLGVLFSNRILVPTEPKDQIIHARRGSVDFELTSEDCATNKKLPLEKEDVVAELNKANGAIESLDNSIAKLRLKLPSTKNSHKIENFENSTAVDIFPDSTLTRKKAFMVVGINTAFSSRKRRDSVRETWMPRGRSLLKLEQEKGIVVRFMIGHSSTSNSILDRAIASEDAQHKDFLRLEHVEGYHELSAKTKAFFSTAVKRWDAEFYVKVDDDVHVNLGTLAATLVRHRAKPRVYIGCMKSGPVLYQKNVKYHEPEYWKFGEEGNRYFRHATGQIYAISKELAQYISMNQPILHKYANEDVSLGAWFIGLEVDHIDDHNLCCGTPPECEWRAQAGNMCVASFDWSCSGICKSVERIKDVHAKCGEDTATLWNALV